MSETRSEQSASAMSRRAAKAPTEALLTFFTEKPHSASDNRPVKISERALTPSWCDKLASTPTVGFRLSPQYRSATRLLDVLGPILDSDVRVVGQVIKPKFVVEKLDQFEVIVSLGNGFRMGIAPTNIWVGFNHRMEIKPRSGDIPTVDYLTEARPYTELLPNVCHQLLDMTIITPDIEKRKVISFGVIATTVVNEADLPPGILQILENMLDFWGTAEGYTLQITSRISKCDEFYDRCIHTFTRLEDTESVPSVNLDWQRVFTKPKLARKALLREVIDLGAADALSYFEKLGGGALADVQ